MKTPHSSADSIPEIFRSASALVSPSSTSSHPHATFTRAPLPEPYCTPSNPFTSGVQLEQPTGLWQLQAAAAIRILAWSTVTHMQRCSSPQSQVEGENKKRTERRRETETEAPSGESKMRQRHKRCAERKMPSRRVNNNTGG